MYLTWAGIGGTDGALSVLVYLRGCCCCRSGLISGLLADRSLFRTAVSWAFCTVPGGSEGRMPGPRPLAKYGLPFPVVLEILRAIAGAVFR